MMTPYPKKPPLYGASNVAMSPNKTDLYGPQTQGPTSLPPPQPTPGGIMPVTPKPVIPPGYKPPAFDPNAGIFDDYGPKPTQLPPGYVPQPFDPNAIQYGTGASPSPSAPPPGWDPYAGQNNGLPVGAPPGPTSPAPYSGQTPTPQTQQPSPVQGSSWPPNIPHPPPGVMYGTDDYFKWLKQNDIDPRGPLNYQIQQAMWLEQFGGLVNPGSISPNFESPEAYAKYMQDYLARLGFAPGDAPPGFDQGLADYYSDYGRGLGQEAAGYIDVPYAEQMPGFDQLSLFMNMQDQYLADYGGYAAFDPRPLQEMGVAQAELARSSMTRGLEDSLASSGLLGQANSAYSYAPLANEYSMARINAVQDPLELALSLGPEAVGMTMGQLQGLYENQLRAQGMQADIFGQLANAGMQTGATAGLGSAANELDAWLKQQYLYSQFPMQGYEASYNSSMDWNRLLMDLYQQGVAQSDASKRRKMERDQAEDAALGGGIGSAITGLGSLALAPFTGGTSLLGMLPGAIPGLSGWGSSGQGGGMWDNAQDIWDPRYGPPMPRE